MKYVLVFVLLTCVLSAFLKEAWRLLLLRELICKRKLPAKFLIQVLLSAFILNKDCIGANQEVRIATAEANSVVR